jgi:hypothetical protein
MWLRQQLLLGLLVLAGRLALMGLLRLLVLAGKLLLAGCPVLVRRATVRRATVRRATVADRRPREAGLTGPEVTGPEQGGLGPGGLEPGGLELADELREFLADLAGRPELRAAGLELPLFGAGIGLDSLSGVDVAAEDLNLDALASLASLASFIETRRG